MPQAISFLVIFILRAEIVFPADVIPAVPVKGKSLAQSIDVFTNCLVINLALIRGQGIRNGTDGSYIADVVHQEIDQLMKKRFIPEPVFSHDISDNERIQDFCVDIAVLLNFIFIQIGSGHAAFRNVFR